MTPQEIQARINAFTEKVGPLAYVSMVMSSGRAGKPLITTIYPNGVVDGRVAVHPPLSTTFEEAFANMEAEWAKHQASFNVDTIRKMALDIIDLTDALGECTIDSLAKRHPRSVVERLAADACEVAGGIAGKPYAVDLHSEARFAA